MDRLTVVTQKGAALKMDDAYPSEDAARAALMEKRRVVVKRLADYEDTGLEPEEIIALCEMDRRAKMAEFLRKEENAPLSLEKLCEMCGAWVWVIVQYKHCKCDGFAKIITHFAAAYFDQILNFNDYGKTWLAYRRKPEEVAK